MKETARRGENERKEDNAHSKQQPNAGKENRAYIVKALGTDQVGRYGSGSLAHPLNDKIKEEKSNKEEPEEAIAATEDFAGAGAISGSFQDDSDWGEKENVDSGFKRFQDIVHHEADHAAAMVRAWIQHPGKNGPLEALLTLPQVLDSKSLMSLFSLLTLEERKLWKAVLSEKMTGPSNSEARVAESFISRQIVESMLIPNPITDHELKKLLQSLSLKECVELMSGHPEYSPLLINLLPTAIVSRIYSLLPQDKADDITLMSIKYSDTEFAEKGMELKERINEFKNNQVARSSAPFVENITELLRTVDDNKERSIWNALLEAGETAVILSTAAKVFPSHLAVKLPAATLKAVLDRFTAAKKADFIFSMNEQNQKFYLEVCGKEGSKVREIIDYELKQIGNNDLRKKKISKAAPALQKEFVENIRSIVIADEHVRDVALEVIQQWIRQSGPGENHIQKAA